MLEKIANWLESVALPCFYKAFLGVECPGCGMQTSFIELIRGNILESLKVYPALTSSLALVFLLIIHLIFKFEKGALLLKILFIFNALIMVLHYIYRILTY